MKKMNGMKSFPCFLKAKAIDQYVSSFTVSQSASASLARHYNIHAHSEHDHQNMELKGVDEDFHPRNLYVRRLSELTPLNTLFLVL